MYQTEPFAQAQLRVYYHSSPRPKVKTRHCRHRPSQDHVTSFRANMPPCPYPPPKPLRQPDGNLHSSPLPRTSAEPTISPSNLLMTSPIYSLPVDLGESQHQRGCSPAILHLQGLGGARAIVIFSSVCTLYLPGRATMIPVQCCQQAYGIFQEHRTESCLLRLLLQNLEH